MIKQKFQVGDVITTVTGNTPWRINSIEKGQGWFTRGVQVYRCTSLRSGRREEFRLTNTGLYPWTGPLPTAEPTPSTLKGHTLVAEGAPHNPNGVRIANLHRTTGTGQGLCSCGALSEVLHSAGQRKKWHREHKDAIRAGRLA